MEAALTRRELQQARLRAVRRAKVQARNEPPRLTAAEEGINAGSHGAGALLAAAALCLLLVKSHTPMEVLASCVYGVSMVLMMLMSGVYHAMPTGSRAKRVCRRFDYTSIYLLIGGTFAPGAAAVSGRHGGYRDVLRPMAGDSGRSIRSGPLRTRTLARSAFHPLFPDRLERSGVPSRDASERACAPGLYLCRRASVYPGHDSLRPEKEIQPLCLAYVRPGSGGAPLGRHLYAAVLTESVFRVIQKQKARP